MAITSSFANLATVTRASKKTDAGGWDFINGSVVGALSVYSSGVAAIHADAGLLVEESTVNEVRNPRCEGATGTTQPTHWRNSGSDMTLNFEIVEVDGWPGVRVTGTSGGAAEELSLYFEGTQQTSAAQSEDWTASLGVKEESGPALTSAELYQYEYDSGGSELASGAGSSFSTSLDTSHRRFYHSRNLTHASTAYVAPRLRIVFAASGAFSFVLFAPQNENKAYPTSPVLPTAASPAASTRAEDAITVALGSWFDASDMTFFMEAKVGRLLASQDARLFSVDDGTSANRINMQIDPSGGPELFIAAASSTQTNVGDALGLATGDTVKVAAAISADDVAVSYGGGDQDTDDGVTVPTGMTTLRLGNWHSTADRQLGGYIRDFRYWPRRLTNAELEALVGN